jgi:hypothetical protein
MRRALLGLSLGWSLVLGGCKHTNPTTDVAVGEAVSRTISYALGAQAEPRPDTVGVAVRGRLLLVGPYGTAGLPYTRVTLSHDGRAIATVASDRRGDFFFKNELRRGRYDLTVDSDAYQGDAHFEVDCVTAQVTVYAALAR